MGCMEKAENIEYLWSNATAFIQCFRSVLEDNGLVNKNYRNMIDIRDQDHSKGNL